MPLPDATPRLECHVLDTGHCLASQHHLLRDGRWNTVRCHAIAALLRHPAQGWFLWDAGYAPRLLAATQRFPFRLYRWATPLHVRPEQAVVAQLARFGVRPRDVRRVILSHFHADHVAGLRDFPEAEFIASEEAYADVVSRRGISALSRAFVPELLPPDFGRRARLLPPLGATALATLGPVHDLFSDGSVLLAALPGHARGQLGLLAQTEGQPVLFAADGCWLSESYRRNEPPHWLTHGLVDSAAAMRGTLARLHQFAKEHPEVAIVPSHCPEAFERLVGARP